MRAITAPNGQPLPPPPSRVIETIVVRDYQSIPRQLSRICPKETVNGESELFGQKAVYWQLLNKVWPGTSWQVCHDSHQNKEWKKKSKLCNRSAWVLRTTLGICDYMFSMHKALGSMLLALWANMCAHIHKHNPLYLCDWTTYKICSLENRIDTNRQLWS